MIKCWRRCETVGANVWSASFVLPEASSVSHVVPCMVREASVELTIEVLEWILDPKGQKKA